MRRSTDNQHRLEPRQLSATGAPAFTLVELLVSLGIIALLIAILLPTLSRARASASAVRCAAQLREIGAGINAYVISNNGYAHRAQNQDAWLRVWAPPGQPAELRLIDPNNTAAYWGTAYLPYMTARATVEATGDGTQELLAVARRYFLCPSGGLTDPSFGNTDPTLPVSYGINAAAVLGKNTVSIVAGKPTVTTQWAKLYRFKKPSSLIVVQDAAEHRLDNLEGNTLSDYGTGLNLRDWRPGGKYADRLPNAVHEYYRHNRRCNLLWLDWHVSSQPESTGGDVKREWYQATESR